MVNLNIHPMMETFDPEMCNPASSPPLRKFKFCRTIRAFAMYMKLDVKISNVLCADEHTVRSETFEKVRVVEMVTGASSSTVS